MGLMRPSVWILLVVLSAGILEQILAVQKLDELDIEGIYPLLDILLQRQAGTIHRRCFTSEGFDGEDQHSAAMQKLSGMDTAAACEAVRGYLTAATAKDCALMVTIRPLPPRAAGASRAPTKDADMAATTEGLQMAGLENASGCGDCCRTAQHVMCADQQGSAGMGNKDTERGVIHEQGVSHLPAEQQDPCVGSWAQDCGSGRSFNYKLAVVDLDMKLTSKVCEHFKLDKQILANWNASVAHVSFG